MVKIPRMNRLVRRELVLLGRRTGDPATAMRFLAIARLGLGHSSVRVANDLDVARSTVVRTATRFATDGTVGLLDQRQHNGVAKVDGRFRRRVVQLLQRTPQDFGWMRPTWTRELLGLQMQRDGYVAVAACTMGRVLAKIGARLGTPKRSCSAHGRATKDCAFWRRSGASKVEPAPRSPCCTATRSTST